MPSLSLSKSVNVYHNLIKSKFEIIHLIKLFLFSGRFVSLCVHVSSDSFDVGQIRK